MLRTTALLVALTAVVGMSGCGSSKDTDTNASAPGSVAGVPDTTPVTGADTTPTNGPVPTDGATPVSQPDTTPDTTPDMTPATEPQTIPAADVSVLIGRQWVPESFITVGPLDTIPADLGASIMFQDDGTVHVDTGCNAGAASVTIEGDQLTIEPIVLTKKACAQNVMDLEQRIVGLLQEPSYWSVDGDTLKIYPANITDTGIIFHDGDLQVAPPETFQTTS